MIIDGIEYEDEPGFTDPETGKPVYYAKNVPDLLRGDLALDQAQETQIVALNSLASEPLSLAKKGAKAWNLWVKANALHWLEIVQNPDFTQVCMMPTCGYVWEDDYFQDNGVDFSIQKDVVGIAGQALPKIDMIDFKGFVFPFPVSFTNVRFKNEAWFGGAIFCHEVWFDGAIFEKEAGFRGAVFIQEAGFRGVEFRADAWFGSAVFLGDAWFDGITIRGEAGFRFTWFKEDSWFTGATIKQEAWFDSAVFEKDAGFNGATFRGKLSMQRALFFDGTRWDDSKFCKLVDFSYSHFMGDASFRNTKFNASTNYDHVLFCKGFDGRRFSTHWEWGTELLYRYYAANSEIDGGGVPDFRGAVFQVAPNLGYVEIQATSGVWLLWHESFFANDGLKSSDRVVKDGDASAKLRVLGELARRGHNHIGERRFFRKELLARRGYETDGLREVIMINLFEWFSMCGLSFRRPMWWLVGVIIISAVFYWSQINWFLVEEDRGPFELASYSFANSLPLLGYISDSYEVSVNVLFDGIDKVPGVVRVWAFAQNVVSAILIFFGLLAIRNYFKLG